jgi:quercetin dioxygenase-like cupin family protein
VIRALALLAAAATTVAAPSSGPVTMAEVDVPRDHGPQQVVVQTREFAGKSESGWHVHPGIEIATVVDGEIELHTAAGVLKLEEGDSFTMPRGVAHNGVNPKSTAAALVITLVVDKGKPLRSAVAAPKK